MISLRTMLAAAAAALACASPLAAQTLFSDGAWRAAYATLSDGGAVCAAETRDGAARLTVMVFSDGDATLALEDPAWRMPEGALRVFTLSVGDRNWPVTARGRGAAAFADLRNGDGRTLLAALSDRSAIALRAGANAAPRRFSADGVAAALAALDRCASDRLGVVGTGRPMRSAAAQ